MYWIIFLKKESNLVTSSKNDIFMQAGFVLTFLVIFGISSGFEQTGDMVKVGLIWFLMMFLSLLNNNRLLKDDFNDGSLIYLILSNYSLPNSVLIKVLSNWFCSNIVLFISMPIVMLFLSLNMNLIIPIIVSVVLGSCTISLLSSIGTALTLTISKNTFLLFIIMLPLYVPIFLLGLTMVKLAKFELSYFGVLYLMIAILSASILIIPYLVAIIIRIHYD